MCINTLSVGHSRILQADLGTGMHICFFIKHRGELHGTTGFNVKSIFLYRDFNQFYKVEVEDIFFLSEMLKKGQYFSVLLLIYDIKMSLISNKAVKSLGLIIGFTNLRFLDGNQNQKNSKWSNSL